MKSKFITESEILPVIDAHAHIFPNDIAEKAKNSVSEFYNIPMYTTGTLSELYKVRTGSFQNRKIISQVIFSPAVTAKQTANINNFISEICKKDKSLIGFGTIHKDNKDYKSEIQHIKQLGLIGIKIHSDFQRTDIDDEQMIPIYKNAAENNLPVIFHMGDRKRKYSSVQKLKNVLDEIPNLTVIASHMGGYLHWQESYNILNYDSRLYFDISSTLGFVSAYEINIMLEKFGTNHIFFGSNFPMWNPNDELRKLADLKLDDTVRRKIEYYNFINFLQKYIEKK